MVLKTACWLLTPWYGCECLYLAVQHHGMRSKHGGASAAASLG